VARQQTSFAHQTTLLAAGGAMNNVIRFPNPRPEPCHICEAWPKGRRERLLIEDIPLKEAVCHDCLLAFWEALMSTDASQREQAVAR
jgi:hypothetical protein